MCERVLPSFDTTKSLKTILLTANGLQTFNRIRSRGRHVFSVLFQVGNLLMVIAVLSPKSIGRYPAILAPILQLPGLLLITAAIRVDMVRILVTTYDFWFLTVSNAILCACFAVVLADLRIGSMIVGCLIVQVSICADAQVGNAQQLLLSSVVNTIVHAILFTAVLLDIIDSSSSKETPLLRSASSEHTMSTRDVLMNTQMNMVVLFAKLVYRNWRIVRGRVRTGRQVSLRSVLIPQTRKCVTYQCVLKLAPISSIATTLPPRSRGSMASTSVIPTHGITQLEPVFIREVFHARNTILPLRHGGIMESLLLPPDAGEQRARCGSKRAIRLTVLYMTGVLGSVISLLAADPMGWLPFRKTGGVIEVASLLLSSAFCGVFFACYHRRLLKRLVSTFDYVFLSSKITIGCCCISAVLEWDERTLSVWCLWMWMHWAISLDALTPSTAAALAFRRVYILPVVVVMIVTYLLLALEFLYWHPERVSDWYLIQMTVAGRQVSMRMMPFFVARIWSVLLWSGRLLWRIVTRESEDERLMLQGQVEFHFHWKKRLPSRVPIPPGGIAIRARAPRPVVMTPRRIQPEPAQ